MNSLVVAQTLINMFYTIFLICASIGGVFAWRHGRKTAIVTIQSETITALEAQINAVKEELHGLRDENTRLKQQFEMIKEALSKRGIHVTLDGETIIISEQNVKQTITRVRKTTKTPEAAK